VAKLGKDPIYRTKVIVQKPVWSFPHDNFSSVNWIFNKLGNMIPLRKGKNSIYFGVIRSKVKITVTINIIVDNRMVSQSHNTARLETGV
jgi:hypothetical protein